MHTRFTMDREMIFRGEIVAMVGDAIQGDEWDTAMRIIPGDEVDQEVFNTGLRFDRNCDIIPSLPVRVEITGRKVHFGTFSKMMRCKIITWNNDEEENPGFGGWIFLHAERF